jgi:hypothetical protein
VCQKNNEESPFKVMVGESHSNIALYSTKARRFQSLLAIMELYLCPEMFDYIFNYLSGGKYNLVKNFSIYIYIYCILCLCIWSLLDARLVHDFMYIYIYISYAVNTWSCKCFDGLSCVSNQSLLYSNLRQPKKDDTSKILSKPREITYAFSLRKPCAPSCAQSHGSKGFPPLLLSSLFTLLTRSLSC